ncbi:outer membrane beta-barrel family protein [Flavihumibacter cheonanensis]
MVYDYPPIQVTVFNEKKEPLDFVSVRILQKADSGRVFSTVSDSTGNLALPDLKPGDYLLCVSRVDYEPACQDLIISANNTNTTPQILTIILHASTQLSTVTVTAKKPPVQFLSDRTVIRVDASINNAGTTALEVLERSPGITLDKDGNISLKGRDQVLVMIDNKPSYLTGAELNALLQGMSSNDIETIELIDNPPARYDAAGNGGIINIRLKKNRQRGFNGNLSLSGAQGIYPKSNNALSLNYYSGKVNLYTNYSMTINQNLLDMYAFRSYYADDDKTLLSTLEQPTFIQSTAKNHTLRTGMDYTLNKKTSLGIALAGTQIDRNGTGRGEASWKSANNLPDSLIRTRNSNSTDWKNASINLNLRHQFSAKQELTADLDWLGYQIKGSQGFQNIRSDNNSYMESFLGELPSKIRILSFKADHQLQLPKQYKLETGVKWAATSTNNKAAYTINQGGGWEEDLGKSNQFLYDEQIRAAYASLERKINRWWYQVGLRYEHTSFDAHQLGNAVIKDSAFSNQYGSLFPSLQASVELDSLNELSLTMNKRIDRPPYQQLNPFVFIINKYTYQKGNPLMKPQFTYTVELSHRYKNLLSTSVSYSDTRDYFSQIFLSDSTGTFYYSEGNLGRRKILGLSVSFSEQLLPFWNFSSQADLQHKKLKGFVWKPLEASITQISISINNQFKLGKGWAMEASGFWISRSQADIQEVVEPTGQVGVGISKQVLKKKGSLKLTARDIFYTQDMEGFTIFNQATEYFRLQRDTRVINLAFTWRFGKQTKTTPRRTNKVDEADRVSG